MMTMIIIGSLLVLGIGFLAKLILDKLQSDYKITITEFGIAAAVMLVAVIPLTAVIGHKLAYSNAVTYHESWGGYEVNAEFVRITCTRDGAGVHTFDCDPYIVQVPYECGHTEGSGKDAHYVSQTCYRPETRYHDCPYTTEEWTFIVHTTLGDYEIASHWLPTNPEQYRYRSPEGETRRAPSDIPRGIPMFWQRAKDRLDAGQPGPVTARRDYDNYILASQHTILKKYSQDIERYKKEGVLPQFNPNIKEEYLQDRAYFVGVQPAGDWQKAVNYFNGAFGIELQGDLHLVIVDANKVTDPETYAGALSAYWQSPEFGHNAMSKNALLVVVGTTDGKTVAWARGVTGMPRGNEALLIDIRDKLPGTKLDPASLLGEPKGELYTQGSKIMVRVVHAQNQGALESVIWGADKFERVHMKDFSYLSHEIQPSSSQQFWMYFCIVLFGCIAWGVCILVGPNTFHQYRR